MPDKRVLMFRRALKIVINFFFEDNTRNDLDRIKQQNNEGLHRLFVKLVAYGH